MASLIESAPWSRASRNRAVVSLVIALSLTVGCVSTQTEAPAPQSTTRIDVQEDVGFTITEDDTASDAVRLSYDEAVGLLRQGEHRRGIAALESLVADAPGLSAPLIDLGIAKHRSGDLEAAEQHFRSALKLAPDHPLVHNELGILYRKSGRFAEARASYERALAVFPGYHYARRNLAILCDLYLGDLPCALENYEAYMATVPEDEEASIWIADIRMRLDNEDLP